MLLHFAPWIQKEIGGGERFEAEEEVKQKRKESGGLERRRRRWQRLMLCWVRRAVVSMSPQALGGLGLTSLICRQSRGKNTAGPCAFNTYRFALGSTQGSN